MTVTVLICGGGNGAHVYAGLAASQPDTEARVLTLFADEAERWTNNMKDGFVVTCHSTGKDPVKITGKPTIVTKDPAVAAPGVDVVVFVVPAFAHNGYLEALKPHIKPGTVLVGIPGQAGFEFAVKGIWGELGRQCSILSFESLPWACRLTDFGKSAEVLGTKGTLVGAVQLGSVPPKFDATAMVQQTLGELPKLMTSGHLLGITLMSTNGYLHPSIMYGQWKDWDGTPKDSPPLFYNGLDQFSADTLSSVGDEIVATAKGIMQQRPQVDLSNVSHIFQWFLRCYANDITDKTSLYTAIQTNKAYTGLTHPCVQDAGGKYLPNFNYRYMTEDIPFGLVVMRSIAEVAGVPTPTMDTIITWAQKCMGKEYLVNGKLCGKDMKETRTPHRFDLCTLDQMLGL